MIVFPQDSMRSDLERLWRVCFGDSYEYIRYFFENRYIPENCLVYVDESGYLFGWEKGHPSILSFGHRIGFGVSGRIVEDGHGVDDEKDCEDYNSEQVESMELDVPAKHVE